MPPPIPEGFQLIAGGQRSATTGLGREEFPIPKGLKPPRRCPSERGKMRAMPLKYPIAWEHACDPEGGCYPSGIGIPRASLSGGGAALTTGYGLVSLRDQSS